MTPAARPEASEPAAPRREDTAGPWREDTVDARVIAHLNARAVRADGVAPLSGHVLDAIAHGRAAWLPLGRPPVKTAQSTAGGQPNGADQSGMDSVAVAFGADPAEVVVDPDFRRRGMGAALVRAAVDRQGAVWAYGDLPAAAGLAGRLGLVRSRVLLQMRRHRDPGAPGAPGMEIVPPPGITLRPFIPGRDEQAFLRVNARAFAWHPEQGRLDLGGLRADMAQPWFDPAGFFLAVRPSGAGGDEVVGFHWTKVHPADPAPGAGQPVARSAGPVGEVYVIGVDPDAGVRGLGTPLTAAGLDYLGRRGIGTVMLYVEGDNDRALRLYERFGFTTNLANVVYAAPAQPAG